MTIDPIDPIDSIETDLFSSLPNEIVEMILLKLDAISLLNLSQVSQRFKDFLDSNNESFWKRKIGPGHQVGERQLTWWAPSVRTHVTYKQLWWQKNELPRIDLYIYFDASINYKVELGYFVQRITDISSTHLQQMQCPPFLDTFVYGHGDLGIVLSLFSAGLVFRKIRKDIWKIPPYLHLPKDLLRHSNTTLLRKVEIIKINFKHVNH